MRRGAPGLMQRPRWGGTYILACCTTSYSFEFAFVIAAHCCCGSSGVLATLHAAQAMQFWAQHSLTSLYNARNLAHIDAIH